VSSSRTPSGKKKNEGKGKPGYWLMLVTGFGLVGSRPYTIGLDPALKKQKYKKKLKKKIIFFLF
jgi:hypothetical protein